LQAFSTNEGGLKVAVRRRQSRLTASERLPSPHLNQQRLLTS
jgi:hypothetical protein